MNYTEKYGPWALVVGASAGLGAAWADECAKRGFNVAVCARRLEKLQGVTAVLREKYNVETKEFSVDISKDDVADQILKEIEGLDIGMFIYNAAVEMAGPFIKVKEEYHMRQIIGNAINPMRLSWHIAREMAKKHRGCILLLSSMSSLVGTSNQSSYSACKAFEMQLAETLWYEMGKYGVDVSGVLVGSIATPEFLRQQAAQGTNMEAGQGYAIQSLIGDLKIEPACLLATPHTPEDAAAYVMQHLGEGPRLHTHLEDQLADEGYGRMSRKDGTLLLSRVTDAFFSAGHDEQLTDDAGDFEEIRSM